MAALLRPLAALTLRAARVHGAEAARAQAGLERALAGIDDGAAGAILVLRRLAPSVPLGLDAPALPGRFRRAVEEGVAEHRARARRPWSDGAAAAADAVLFANAAELLACLARDWLSGRADAWYWRAVLGSPARAETVHVALCGQGTVISPALAMLAARGLAVPFVARLPDAVADAALAAIAEAHALALSPPQDAGPAPRPSSQAQTLPAWAPPPPVQRALRRLRATAPESEAAGLAAPQRRLLTVALVLARAPGLLPDPAAVHAIAAIASPAPGIRPQPVVEPGAEALAEPLPEPGTVLPSIPPPGAGPGARASAAPAHPIPAGARPGADPAQPAPTTGERAGARPSPAPRPAAAADDRDNAAATMPLEGGALHTGLGGLFYLLNVALAFGLYGDFTQPRAPGIALSPWDFLALAARHWFGETVRDDPVWTLLADLAGRAPADPPGAGFAPPSDWSAPPDWLPPWQPVAAAGVHATRRRLRLLHPDGFVLAQASRAPGTRPLMQARELAAAFPALRHARLHRVAPTRVLGGARAGWLAAVLGTFAARLGAALGVPATEAPALLCRHHAAVIATADTVLVQLSLADLPIEIRLAGLDRDPGWIPAAGRSLAFRFA